MLIASPPEHRVHSVTHFVKEVLRLLWRQAGIVQRVSWILVRGDARVVEVEDNDRRLILAVVQLGTLCAKASHSISLPVWSIER